MQSPTSNPTLQAGGTQTPHASRGEATPASSEAEHGPEVAATLQANSNPDSESVKVPQNPRLEALAARKATLEATLASLQAQRADLSSQARLQSGREMQSTWSEEERTKFAVADANSVIQNHITLLSKYNEIKDIGQGLMGLIANQRDVRVATVMDEFGISEKD